MALPLASKLVMASALGASLFYLVWSDSGEGVLEYLYVEKVATDPDSFRGRRIKVHGTVVPGTVKQKKGETGDYQFVVEHGGKSLPVHYTNLVPDTFQEGGEVVLTGKLESDGTFESDEMSAKCPSKYEAETELSLSPKGKT